MSEALDRNLYGSTLPQPDIVADMAAYTRRQMTALSTYPLDRLVAGEIAFAPAAPAP